MHIPGITWKGESAEDVEILPDLPTELVRSLSDTNGFILHHGALHVRGACLTPEWHSLRAVWHGPNAFHTLYPAIRPSDLPFAQDQLGDQFLIREGAVMRLVSETGQIEHMCGCLTDFFEQVAKDVEGFLNVGLSYILEPGQLLHAYPPFCVGEASASVSLRPCPAQQVILVHARLAKEIADIPDGTRIEIRAPSRRTRGRTK
jgi:hypothetical protein